MVDAIVSFALERLGRLGDFLIQEAIFLQGVRDEVEWLKRELRMMQCFLKDAEEKQDGDNRIRQWISDIRDVAYDSEDVIDTFILKVKEEGMSTQGTSTQGSTPERGFLASLKKCSCINFNKEIHKEIHKEIDLYNIGKEIEALKKRVDEISSRREAYGIKNIGDVGEGTSGATGKLRQLRRTSSYADEEHVVGFKDVAASLVDELLKEEPRRCVISILGMGGLGKTTLARKLYHHSVVEGKFKYRAWVCVSEYRIEDLLQRIIRSLKQVSKEELEMLEKMTEEDLERYLRQFLKGHRYLVVIDDVWHYEAWESLRRAFPDNSRGSRVIVTTRIKAIAERSDPRTCVHELRFLRSDESWELFCKKAFPNHNATSGYTSHCPPGLQMLGSEMVEKCGGLPLAIIVLGGLLSRKQPREWHTVKEHIWRDLRDDSIHIEPILALSYNHLPNHLKPCFLHLGLFPEDFKISAKKLIHLWVAEGFIPLEEETLEEEVAENWLNELIGRSLIQVEKRNWRRITACRVHDLLRDLAVKKAKELNFLHFYEGRINSAMSSNTASSYRRQAVHSTRIERYVSVEYSIPCLRALLFFSPEGGPINIQWLARRFRLLRVLDLHYVLCDTRSLPDAVGELIHLRYLGLRKTGINELPPSLVNLQALQTIDAFGDNLVSFPGDICKLKQLRHLMGYFEGPFVVDHLKNLQTLKVIYWDKINPVNLINLRELHTRVGPGFTLEFQPLSHCPHLLQLVIDGRIENLPEQIHKYLPNLEYLELKNSELMKDPMPTLEKLPNLMILELRYLDLKKLTCTAKGFLRLEVLKIYDLRYLEELEVEEAALPMLKGLSTDECNKLLVPERLRSIPNARNLNWDWRKHFD